MISFFFGISSLIITFFSYRYPYNNFQEGIIPYICFYWLYIFVAYLLKRKFTNSAVNYKILFLLSIPLLGSSPLFENDHHRYFWEGKVLASGGDPYLFSPNASKLKNIEYEKKDQIGYPDVSSIYPPLALMYFSLSSNFDYKFKLVFFQLINIFLVLIFVKLLKQANDNNFLIVLFFPMLQKEFINSIHLDLLMTVLFTLSVLGKGSSFKKLWPFLSSVLIKISSIIIYPYYYFKTSDSKKMFLISLAIGLVTIIIMFPKFDTGLTAFSQNWLWAPGFLGLIDFSQYKYIKITKVISVGVFFIFYILSLKNINKNNRNILAMHAIALMFFLAPVVNSWYFILLVPFAFINKSNFLILYCLFSVNTYFQWILHQSQIIALLVHLPIISYYTFIFYYKIFNSKNNSAPIWTR